MAGGGEAVLTSKEFITADSLLRDSLALGLQVVRSGFRPTVLVGIWRGGAPIGIAVVASLISFGALASGMPGVRFVSAPALLSETLWLGSTAVADAGAAVSVGEEADCCCGAEGGGGARGIWRWKRQGGEGEG